MSLNKFMHPRNPYKQQKPDFKFLASKYPEFCGHVTQDKTGKMFLDFKDPEALRVLTRTLLKEDFDLEVDLPRDRLVPTVPLRLNYLLWLEDIIGQRGTEVKRGTDVKGGTDMKGGMNVKGIDIGTGASCVYPLLGYKTSGWTFLATDVDAQNVFYAKKNVEKNKFESVITVKKVTEDALITGALLDTDTAITYDFCMCNPPFFADHLEAQAISTSRNVDRADPSSISTASPKECIAQGGEVAFVKRLMVDSMSLRERVRVYTTMVGKKTSLPPLKEELRKLQVEKFATTEFCQGKTMRWGIAWTFDNTVVFPKSEFQSSKNEKPPLSYRVPLGAGGAIYDVPSLTQHLKTILDQLQIQYKEKKCHKGFSSLSTLAYENTWSNQRRRRRQKMRETADHNPEPGGDHSELGSAGDNSESNKNVSNEAINGANSASNKGDNSASNKGDNSESSKGDNSESNETNKGDNIEVDTGKLRAGDNHADIDNPHKTSNSTMVEEISSTDRKRKLAESEETGQTKRTKAASAEQDSSVSKNSCEQPAAGKQTMSESRGRYILKCDINLKKPAGVRDITLEVVWRDGDSRELMHQVMQYFKNKLKSPC